MLVIDNCTLSALYRLDLLSLPLHLFSEVIVPLAVQSEFRDHWKDIPVLTCFNLKSEKPPLHDKLDKDTAFHRLGKGEREVIAWRMEKQSLLATDDDKQER